jgi:hypothetical protein
MVCEVFDWAKNSLPMNDLEEIALLWDKIAIITIIYRGYDNSYIDLLLETNNELISSYEKNFRILYI